MISFIIFAVFTALLWFFEKQNVSRTKRNIIAIFLGGLIGFSFQYITFFDKSLAVSLFSILGNVYLRFLQMLTYPVVSLAILLAFLKIADEGGELKSPIYIISILLILTGISALVGIYSVILFKPDLSFLSQISIQESAIESLNQRENLLKKPFDKFITDFIPSNPFLDFTGARSVSLASVVVFCSLIGFAYLTLDKTAKNEALKFKSFIEIAYKLIMILVGFALKITPYGVLGLFVKLASTLQLTEVIKLLNFVLISYLAIFAMFVIHGILLLLFKINPINYYKKTAELLMFGFFSRSSSAAIPLNIQTQTAKLGISEKNATISASLGSSIGQNGCAGIYPAMLVSMVAISMGIEITTPTFILHLALIIVINSFGIAGVGGGAIFAAIASLSAFQMPFAIVVILAGIEPIIDMARTALNINGVVVSSAISQKITSKD